jgi:hypothetical protein
MRLAASLVCVTAFLLGGCVGSPPTFTPTVPEARARLAGTIGTVSASVDPTANGAGDVRMIFGSDGIPGQWRSALASALDQSRIFDKSPHVFDVTVTIYRMKPPDTGSTIDTPAAARYQIIDAKSRGVVFETVVENIGHVGPSENFLGVVRIRDSIDRAVQGNIKIFIERLVIVPSLSHQ